ncbi:MAG: hypothetical protein JXR03_07570 [Cyclobacteriaceae bacterium]
MNWKKKFAYLLTLTIFFYSCDSFQDDMGPTDEEELDVKNAIASLPNTPLFIDLKKAINTAEAVRFEINTSPVKGNATISDDAVLLYVPFEDFKVGQDFLSLNLLNSSGSTIDTDSIFISMTASEDSLPCFNGALSDYYTTQKDQSVVIYPISNDGYCVEEISGAVMDIKEEPLNGSLEKIELFTYNYTPDDGFEGVDEFMYELTLIDGEGNEFYSLAQVNIEVAQKQDTITSFCDSLHSMPQYFHLTIPKQDHYLFDPIMRDPFCGQIALDFEVDIIRVYGGSATVTEDKHIKYIPGDALADTIIYDLTYPTNKNRRSIIIEFVDTQCTSILEAADDFYELTFDTDSIGTMQHPYLINIADNDIHCFDYTLEILEHPEIGVANIHQSFDGTHIPLLSYYSEEEFTGERNTELRYKICNDTKCDEAIVTLKLTK